MCSCEIGQVVVVCIAGAISLKHALLLCNGTLNHEAVSWERTKVPVLHSLTGEVVQLRSTPA